MKIFVAPGEFGGGAYYRMVLPYTLLAETGDHEVRFAPMDPNVSSYNDLQWCDAIVGQCTNTAIGVEAMKHYQAMGKKFILEFDDNYHEIPPSNPCSSQFGPDSDGCKYFKDAILNADVCVAATQPLADYYSKWRGDKIWVAENFVHSKVLEAVKPDVITGEPKRKGRITIGYAGSPTHSGDLYGAVPSLRSLMDRYPSLHLRFLGQWPIGLDDYNDRVVYCGAIGPKGGETLPDMMMRYYQAIRDMQMDIAICPLQNTLFNRCKSNVKLLEMGMLGIPCAADKVGPYILRFPDSLSLESLPALVANSDIRQQLAASGLDVIREYHTDRIEPWQKMLESIGAKV